MKLVSVICLSETAVTNLIRWRGVKELTDVAVAAIEHNVMIRNINGFFPYIQWNRDVVFEGDGENKR